LTSFIEPDLAGGLLIKTVNGTFPLRVFLSRLVCSAEPSLSNQVTKSTARFVLHGEHLLPTLVKVLPEALSLTLRKEEPARINFLRSPRFRRITTGGDKKMQHRPELLDLLANHQSEALGSEEI
jgi:hypothetical protein